MRALRIATSLIFACSVAFPAFAVELDEANLPPEAKAAMDKAVQSVPVTAGGSYDYSSIKLTKKEYLDQLGKSFDAMDSNGDGVVEGAELMKGSPALSGNDGMDVDDVKSRSVAPAGGVAPLNAKDLIEQ